MPPQVAPHPKPSGFVITLHSSHPAALSVACEEIKVRKATKAKPGDQLSYSLAFETHGVIEQALQGIYRRQARTPVVTKATDKIALQPTLQAVFEPPVTPLLPRLSRRHRKEAKLLKHRLERQWSISQAVINFHSKRPHFGCNAHLEERKSILCRLMKRKIALLTYHWPHPRASSPPLTPWLTLQEFFQCLWNLPTATPQVSLPGILCPTAPLSALSQYLWLKIQPSTYRSSPRSTVSHGLRWQLALHAKAMATAWDLISQTHLELWGQLQDGILTVA